MRLTRIDTGEEVDVEAPTQLFRLEAVPMDDGFSTVAELVSPGDDNWLDAVQQWALRQGCEAPESVRDFANWDESKHPRHDKGSEKGGEFAPKDDDDETMLRADIQALADKVMADYGFSEKADAFVKNFDKWLKGMDIGPCGAVASAAAKSLREKRLDAKPFSAEYDTGAEWGGAPHYAVMVYKNKQPVFIVDLSVAQFDRKAPNLVLRTDAAWKKYMDISENDDPALDSGPGALWTKEDIALWKRRLKL